MCELISCKTCTDIWPKCSNLKGRNVDECLRINILYLTRIKPRKRITRYVCYLCCLKTHTCLEGVIGWGRDPARSSGIHDTSGGIIEMSVAVTFVNTSGGNAFNSSSVSLSHWIDSIVNLPPTSTIVVNNASHKQHSRRDGICFCPYY